MKNSHASRRKFLRQVSTLALAAGLSGWTQTSFAAGNDYKALVCIFLFGGSDSFNMLIPKDKNQYDLYRQARQELAVGAEAILPSTYTLSDGRAFGLHPQLAEIDNLMQQGKVAWQLNMGTLVEPVTRAQYLNKSVLLPPQLFSHNDQQAQWQKLDPFYQDNTGWGGRLADQQQNSSGNKAFSNISLRGSNVFQTAQQTSPYSITTQGPIRVDGYLYSWDASRKTAIDTMLAANYPSPLRQGYADVHRRALAYYEDVRSALDQAPEIQTVFPDSDLSRQLKMVAQMIAAAPSLGVKRQIFFCSQGGFDTHAKQNNDQPRLFSQISQALAAFYQSTVELGVSQQVTSFTLSEFGRTFNSNGDGSDHGWGGHQLVVGDAVKGGFYGKMPDLTIEGADDTDRGRFIPSTAVEQFAAPLAQWFGASSADLDYILPNLGRFGFSDNFMI